MSLNQQEQNIALHAVRLHRDIELAKSDWRFLSDSVENMSEETKTLWTGYRQYLRDLPATLSSDEVATFVAETHIKTFEEWVAEQQEG